MSYIQDPATGQMHGRIPSPPRSGDSPTVSMTPEGTPARLEGRDNPSPSLSRTFEWVEEQDGEKRDIADALAYYIETSGDDISTEDFAHITSVLLAESASQQEVHPTGPIPDKVLGLLSSGQLDAFYAEMEGLQRKDNDRAFIQRLEDIARHIEEEADVNDSTALVASVFHSGIWDYELEYITLESEYYAPLDANRVPSVLGSSANHSLSHLREYLERNLDRETGELFIENTYQLDLVVTRMWSDGQAPPLALQIDPEALDGIPFAQGTDAGKLKVLEAGMFPEGLNFDGTSAGVVIPPSEGTIAWAKSVINSASEEMRYALAREEWVDAAVR